jgi:hypothetical protein
MHGPCITARIMVPWWPLQSLAAALSYWRDRCHSQQFWLYDRQVRQGTNPRQFGECRSTRPVVARTLRGDAWRVHWYQAFGAVSGGCHQDHHGAPLTDDGPTWWVQVRAGVGRPWGGSNPVPEQNGQVGGREEGVNLAHHLAGDFYARTTQVHQVVATAAVVHVALAAHFFGDLLASLAAVASGAGAAVVQDAAIAQLHCHGGLEFGATAALAGGNGVVEVEGFHRSGGSAGPPLR